GELQFTPQTGEVIELGQVVKEMPPTPLLIQPDGAMHSPHAGKPGSYAELANDQIVITDVVAVTPKDRATELAGYVMVSRPLDLGPALAARERAGVAGPPEIAGRPRAMGGPTAGAPTKAMPLSEGGGQLVVTVPPVKGGMQMPLVAGGGGVAGFGLILFV